MALAGARSPPVRPALLPAPLADRYDRPCTDTERKDGLMAGFLIRVLAVAAGLWVASRLFEGISIEDGWTLLWAALALGIINAIVRPVIIIMTLPLTILTLGLFLLIINAAMLSLTAWLFDGMTISSFWSAFFGAIVVAIVSWLVTWFIGGRGRVETITIERI